MDEVVDQFLDRELNNKPSLVIISEPVAFGAPVLEPETSCSPSDGDTGFNSGSTTDGSSSV
ncbi:hypothetical protein [Haloparvum sp. PAK95]|uniref:hypothetical protein n=1 Tax=Haloparvum sp. PAK95 TaxID=3418962 RepID=UPI003D2EB1CE